MPLGAPRKTNQTAQPTSGCLGNKVATEWLDAGRGKGGMVANGWLS